MHSNLPHISQNNLYQFITFRTQDSTDAYLLKLSSLDMKQSHLQYTIDKYLDNSQKGAYLNGNIIQSVKNYLLDLDATFCDIVAFTIMPNHIHILLVQHQELAKVMQKIKGGLSFLINKELRRKGTFWQKDYFDKVVRDERHLETVLKYIQNNALKAGLSDADERFYIYEES